MPARRMSVSTTWPSPGALAVVERLEDADHAQQARGRVGHAEPVPGRVTTGRGRALLVLEPAERLRGLVGAGPRGQRSGTAVSGEVAADDRGVDRARLLVPEAESLGDTGAEVVVDHVGSRRSAGGRSPARPAT